MLPLKLKSRISSNTKTEITFYLSSDRRRLGLEAFYLEKDIVKSSIVGYLKKEDVLDFIGSLKAFLNQKQKSFLVPAISELTNKKHIIISAIKNEEKSDQLREIYLLKIEDLSSSIFVQYSDEAKRFYSLLFFLEKIFDRLLDNIIKDHDK